MLSPLFWLVFLATFFAVKALADAGLGLSAPVARRRARIAVRPSPASASESDLPLQRAA